jgi:hypothetical protein
MYSDYPEVANFITQHRTIGQLSTVRLFRQRIWEIMHSRNSE